MKSLKGKMNLSVTTAGVMILAGLVAFNGSYKSIATASADDEAAVREALMKTADDQRNRSDGVALSLLRPWDQLSARLFPDFIKHLYYIAHINDSTGCNPLRFLLVMRCIMELGSSGY